LHRQEHCASSDRLPLFGQILAALYQDDIVDEDDIRAWHVKPQSQGQDVKSTSLQENYKKCWVTGAHMIKQFDEQDSDEESDEEADSESETVDRAVEPPVPKVLSSQGVESSEEDSSEETSNEDDSGDGSEQDGVS
jgi:translation initiation factor eIF-2B subunit epsilon